MCHVDVLMTAPEPTAGEVYEEVAPAVLGYFRGHGARDPEGLTGDVFVSVTKGLARFRGDRAALRRWVFTIAHHRLIDEFRHAGRARETSFADVPDSTTDDQSPIDAEILQALSALTEEQREVVVLRFVADLRLADVAKILRKRSGAVKMLQARALASLAVTLSSKSD